MTNLFHNPVEIKYGPESINNYLSDWSTSKSTIVVTTSRGRKRVESSNKFADLVKSDNLIWIDDVADNPSLQYFDNKIKFLMPMYESVEQIIGIGGGSVLDAAKVLSVGKSFDDISLESYFYDDANVKINRTCSLHLCPTTSGTGSEVTPFSTVWDTKKKKKLSLSHPSMFPDVALVDYQLTNTLPADITISTALDGLIQCLESVWNRNTNSFIENIALSGIRASLDGFDAYLKSGKFEGSREFFSYASLMSGICISNTRTALCHSVSYPITVHYGIPHGFACCFSLPGVLEALLESDVPKLSEPLLAAFKEVYKLLSNIEISHHYGRLSESGLFNLQNEMFTPGRSDNFILEINHADLSGILKNSIDFWQSRAVRSE